MPMAAKRIRIGIVALDFCLIHSKNLERAHHISDRRNLSRDLGYCGHGGKAFEHRLRDGKPDVRVEVLSTDVDLGQGNRWDNQIHGPSIVGGHLQSR